MFPDAADEIHRVQLSPGDTVLFATDGLPEMRNAKEEDLSWGKLAEIWKDSFCKPADEALDFLFDEVRAFSQNGRHHDDTTPPVLKVPTSATAGEAANPADSGAANSEPIAVLTARS
jgi:serine phosphatase RsbU (regulator of sigma subunit)